MLTKFINLLEEEYASFCCLKERALAKQKVIKASDLDKLVSVITEEQKILDRIDLLEKQRKELLIEIAEKDKEIKQKEILSFNKLCKFASAEEKERLRRLKEDYLSLLAELEEVNNKNKELLHESLLINKHSLKIIREVAGKDFVGKYVADEKRKGHIFEHKV